MNRSRNVIISCVIMTSITISSYMTIPIYAVPISEMLQVSIGQVALLFTFAAVTGIITSLFLGQLLKRFKVKNLVSFSALAVLAFYLSIYFAQNIMVIYVGAILFGISVVFSGFGISQTEISWWVPNGMAKVMSFLTIGLSAMTFVISPIIANAINAFGVRTAALCHGIFAFTVIFIVSRTLLVEHPSHYGIVPEETAQNTEAGRTLALSQIIRTYPFWLILIGIITVMTATTGFTNNASSFYQSIGLDAVKASVCISVFSGMQLVWAPLYGVITDKRGPGIGTAFCGLVGVAVFIAATVIQGFAAALVLAVLSASFAFSGNLGAICYLKVYGAKESASLVGFANAGANIGSMLGAPIAGFIFDATGSFRIFFIIAALLMLFCVTCVGIATGAKVKKTIHAKSA